MTKTLLSDFSFVAYVKRRKDEKDSIDFWFGNWDNLMCQYDRNGQYDVRQP